MNFLFKGTEKELSEYGVGGIKEGLRFKHDDETYKITGNITEDRVGGFLVSFDAENVKTEKLFIFTIDHLNHITMKEKKKRRGGSTSNEKTLDYDNDTLVTAINSFINKSDEGNSFNVGRTTVTPSSLLTTLKKSTTLCKVTGEEGSYVFQPLKKIGSIQSALGTKVCDGIVERYDGKWSQEDETKCRDDGYDDCKQSTIINEQDKEDAYLKTRLSEGRESEGRESEGRESEGRYSRFSVSKDAPSSRIGRLPKRFSRFNGGKTTCSKNTTKKYKTRNSPPYPANSCKNMKKKGNDGKFYVSVAKGGTYRWMPFAKKTKSKR